MVYIKTHIISQRLIYAADLIFKHILGLNYRLLRINDPSTSSHTPIIYYTNQSIYQGVVIPYDSFLEETDIRPQKFNIYTKDIPFIFYQPVDYEYALDFDIFSTTFYLATEYEKWSRPCFDEHGRYDETAYLSYQQQWYEHPLIHLYADMLWEKLVMLYPGLKRRKRSFDYTITFDVDHPWMFLNKPLHVSYGGIVKDLVKRNWNQANKRFQVMVSRKDPNDTFDLIFANCSEKHTRFFFLIDRNSAYDSRFNHRNPAYRQLIQHTSVMGYEIGIHPSYTTFLQPERIEEEISKLSSILKAPVKQSRQHFLKYRLPDTFQALIDTGIERDYTLCNYLTGGFRTGMAIPYPWFDLSINEVTKLWIQPTLLMDVTLNKYLQLSPDEAYTYAESMIEKTRLVKGHYTLLLHNDSLSNDGMWRGWRRTILKIINYLQTSPNGTEYR